MGAEKGFRFVGCLTPAGQVTWRGNDSSDASLGPGTVHVSCTGRCFCLIIKFVSCLCSSFSQGDPHGLWPGWFRPSPDQPLTHRPHLLQPILSQLELGKEQRTGRYGLKGIGFQTYKMKRVTVMDGGDSSTTMQLFFILLNCTLKMVKMVYFMLCVFYNSKTLKKSALVRPLPCSRISQLQSPEPALKVITTWPTAPLTYSAPHPHSWPCSLPGRTPLEEFREALELMNVSMQTPSSLPCAPTQSPAFKPLAILYPYSCHPPLFSVKMRKEKKNDTQEKKRDIQLDLFQVVYSWRKFC